MGGTHKSMKMNPKLSLDTDNLIERIHQEGLASAHPTPKIDTPRDGRMNKDAC
jgi:hypothetical protein